MLGQMIRTAREKKGLSQNELDKLLGSSHGRVSSWERGAAIMKLDRTTKIADVLSISQAPLVAAALQMMLDQAELDYKVAVKPGKAKALNSGAELKKMRLKEGMGLCELARQLEVSAPLVVKFEAGTQQIKPETAWWYANALGVDHKPAVQVALQGLVQRTCGTNFKVSLKEK